MFFCVSHTRHINFPKSHRTDYFTINLDEGWSFYSTDGKLIWYKGYIDDRNIDSWIKDIVNSHVPLFYGNYCAIVVEGNVVSIKNDKARSFPLWYDPDHGLTNLYSNGHIQWTSGIVSMDRDYNLIHTYFDPIGEIPTTAKSPEIIINEIDQLLSDKIGRFVSQQISPIRVFLSGGYDTALLFSYIQKYTTNYEIVLNSHIDYDHFYLKNHGNLNKFWGYKQIHHWREPCILASGAPGDEFTMRSPTTSNLMLMHYGTSIPELLEEGPYFDCTHYSYFDNEKFREMWAEQAANYIPTSLEETIRICCEYNINDWQHWHLGNTLSWTPFRDIELFKLFAQLPLEVLKSQIMNGSIHLKLIRKNNPDILMYLSEQKNSGNYMENLTRLL